MHTTPPDIDHHTKRVVIIVGLLTSHLHALQLTSIAASGLGGSSLYAKRFPLTPCELRQLPLDCHCNSGVNRQH